MGIKQNKNPMSFAITITTNIAGYVYTVNVTDDMRIRLVKEELIKHPDWSGWSYADINLMHVPGGFFEDEKTCADYDIKSGTNLTVARSPWGLASGATSVVGKLADFAS